MVCVFKCASTKKDLVYLVALSGYAALRTFVLIHGGSDGMASNVSLKPPGKFDFKHPDTWLKWKRRFQQYLTATGLDKEDDARKVNVLLYCLGEESDDVLTSTNISNDDRKKYDAVIDKYMGFST